MTTSLRTKQAPKLPATRPVALTNRLHPNINILFWQYRGSATVNLSNERIQIQAKQALWLPANSPHDIHVNADSILLRIFFPNDLVNIEPEMTTPFTFQVEVELADLLMSLVQSDSSLVQRQGILEQYVLDEIAQRYHRPPLPLNPAARKIAELLTRAPGDPRTLNELAQHVHTSPRTLERAFFTETGVIFREWRLQCRISEAKRLLAQGLTTEAVAFRVGYSTASAFGRAFKRQTGTSPGSYAAHITGAVLQ